MFENSVSLFRNYTKKFIAFSDEDWDLILPHLKEKHLPKGEYLARKGRVSNEIGYVIEGCLRQFYIHNEEEKTTYFYFENHLVSSYISCILKTPSELSIEALSDTRLLYFTYDTLQILYEKSQRWERFGRLIAEYLAIGMEERMAGLLMMNPEERYETLLKSGKDKILQRIPQQYIASYLGITAVSLSRIRRRIVDKG